MSLSVVSAVLLLVRCKRNLLVLRLTGEVGSGRPENDAEGVMAPGSREFLEKILRTPKAMRRICKLINVRLRGKLVEDAEGDIVADSLFSTLSALLSSSCSGASKGLEESSRVDIVLDGGPFWGFAFFAVCVRQRVHTVVCGG